jgi:superfamily II DNA or RNA helicase
MEDPSRRAIIVTPTSLQENFKKEMRAYGVKDFSRYDFYTLRKFAMAYSKKKFPDNTMLVIDEAHNLRTKLGPAEIKDRSEFEGKKVKMTAADVAVTCASQAEKVLLLTATMVYNSPYDIANLVAMCHGTRPLSEYQFGKLVADSEQFKHYFKCVISFYRSSSASRTEYPAVTERNVSIPMSMDYYQKYMEVEQGASRWLKIDRPWVFLVGMRQAANKIAECDKCKWILKRLEAGRKTVIFSAFKSNGVKAVQNLLDEAGIKWAEVTGSISKTKRDEAVANYNANRIKVLLITKAGGEGLDLKGTRDVIIMESSWNKAVETQIIGRGVRFRSHAHLPEEERTVDVFYLISEKPTAFRYEGDIKPSADELLKALTLQKEEVLAAFIEKLIPLSIERTKC